MVVNVYSTSVTSENISRFELLAWVNDCLQSNLTKIEEMSTGAAYCQLTDFLFTNSVPIKKVKWNSRQEVDWMNNWSVLQHAWKKIGIDKPVPVQSLMRAKFQDNFEFLQWFKKFFDANYDGHEYDPATARNHEEFPATLPGGTKSKPPMMVAVAARRSVMAQPAQQKPPPTASSRGNGVTTGGRTGTRLGNSARSSGGGGGLTTCSTTAPSPRRVPPSNASAPTSKRPTPSPQNSSAGSKQQTMKGTTTPNRGGGGGGSTGASGKIVAELNLSKQRVLQLETENNELRAHSELYERERNFYFDKLRQIEIITGYAGEGGRVEVAELQKILWDRDESNTIGRMIDRRNASGGTSNDAASPVPQGDAIPQPLKLDSPDERQMQDILMAVEGSGGRPSGQQQNRSQDDSVSEKSNNEGGGGNNALNIAHLEDTFLNSSHDIQAINNIVDQSGESIGQAEFANNNKSGGIPNSSASAISSSDNSQQQQPPVFVAELDETYSKKEDTDNQNQTYNLADGEGDDQNLTHPVISSEHMNTTHPVIEPVPPPHNTTLNGTNLEAHSEDGQKDETHPIINTEREKVMPIVASAPEHAEEEVQLLEHQIAKPILDLSGDLDGAEPPKQH